MMDGQIKMISIENEGRMCLKGSKRVEGTVDLGNKGVI